MGRVPQQKSSKQAAPTGGLRAQKVSKQRNKHHKVVLEDVGQQSRSVLSFRTEPPAGYTFIPAGNPELTAALKEFAKKSNHQIYAVSATPHASRHELSREVHRIGFHFPTEVVASVCSYYGIRLTSGGKLVEEKDDDKLFMRLKQRGLMPDDNGPLSDDKKRDQVTINTEAKQIIKDLFPHIPDNDLFQIIKTAFQLGDGKVGTADEIPLVRRAQLSVVAHIRHTYTSYDKLLRQVPYSEARHRVENETLKKLIDWRGDEDDKQAVEDTLREVVVISDEEDSDDEVEDGQILDNTDVRVQLVDNAGRQDPTASHRPRSPIHINSDDEAPKGYRYVPQVVRRAPVQSHRPALATRQESRYAVWDRYRQEYRAAMVPKPPVRIVERILIDDPARHQAEPSYVSRDQYYEATSQRTMEPPLTHVRALPQPNPPTYVRAADGRLYERIVLHGDSGNASTAPKRNYTPPKGSTQYYRSAPGSPRLYQQTLHQRTPSLDDNDGSIVPSIEVPNGSQASPLPRRNPLEDPANMYQQRYSGAHQPIRQTLIETSDASEQSTKRRRVDASPPASYVHHSDPITTRQMAAQRADERPQSRVVGYVGELTEASPYATRQQVYYEALPASETARQDPRMTILHREPQVYQSPRALNHADSAYRAYPQDYRHSQYPPDAMIVDDQRPTTHIVREHLPPVGQHYQQKSHDTFDQNIPVRYVYADNGNPHDPHGHRGRQLLPDGAHVREREPVQTFAQARDQYDHRRNAQAPSATYPTQSYRDEPSLRTTYVQN